MAIQTPAWVHKAVFYQIFPDRFRRSGRVSADAELEAWDAAPTPYGFKGGDLYGVIERLVYLRDLGITAIYFCPVFSSAANHRYHTYDYFNVDPLLGGNEALRALLDAAHAADIRIVLDGVFNHASRGFWPFHHVMENGAASPYRDWFYFNPRYLSGQRRFEPYPGPQTAAALQGGQGSYDAIGYGAWWNLPALPKLNVSCPAVREYLLNVATHWVEFGIDGWRLDVPNEIDDDGFWREFRSRVRAINPDAYIVGEIWGEASRWLQGDMWDAVMNYQITAACLGFFGGPRLDLSETRRPSSFGHVRQMRAGEFAAETARVNSMYPPEVVASQLNLLDSHDMPRFVTCCGGDRRAQKMAWLYLCLLPGPPCVYYGDEVGVDGRHDPDCRKGFPENKSNWDTAMLDWYRSSIRLRQTEELGQHGLPETLKADGDVLALKVQGHSHTFLAAWNVACQETVMDISSEGHHLSFADPDIVLQSETCRVVESNRGDLRLNLPARSAVVLRVKQDRA
ncbi:MAG: glycoside hydrolase family 13 protein [Planctomycetaceae bacterium]